MKRVEVLPEKHLPTARRRLVREHPGPHGSRGANWKDEVKTVVNGRKRAIKKRRIKIKEAKGEPAKEKTAATGKKRKAKKKKQSVAKKKKKKKRQ